ncbi:hypothetical protein FNV43_RR17062 [Rhamnella rubrinervis]|uniref:Uncharacterized protein n=1 Tax=Rhamnella rubrinervis TaxID=2594499 RepID=A0A8K0GZY8_9ROSA|nr:hypothetical protein FNV43_RR17062 [Rhamnella rubrinervis]
MTINNLVQPVVATVGQVMQNQQPHQPQGHEVRNEGNSILIYEKFRRLKPPSFQGCKRSKVPKAILRIHDRGRICEEGSRVVSHYSFLKTMTIITTSKREGKTYNRKEILRMETITIGRVTLGPEAIMVNPGCVASASNSRLSPFEPASFNYSFGTTVDIPIDSVTQALCNLCKSGECPESLANYEVVKPRVAAVEHISQICLGALDATYSKVNIPEMDKSRYRTRKGEIATNVLGCSSFLLIFDAYDIFHATGSVEGWRGRSFPLFDRFSNIVGRDRATGSGVQNVR